MRVQSKILSFAVLVAILYATQITAVGQDNGLSKHAINTSIGYVRIKEKNGMGMDIRYSYSLLNHLSLIAGVGMDNAYMECEPITAESDIPLIQTERVSLGIEAETSFLDKLSIGASIAAIAQTEFFPHMYYSTYVTGVLVFYAEFEINLMYDITNTIGAGCFANAKVYNMDNMPLIGVGAKMKFNIR